MIKTSPGKLPEKKRVTKPRREPERIEMRVSPHNIPGHGMCTVFELRGNLFALTPKKEILRTKDQGTTWTKAVEAEATAFRIILKQYSEQEKGR